MCTALVRSKIISAHGFAHSLHGIKVVIGKSSLEIMLSFCKTVTSFDLTSQKLDV